MEYRTEIIKILNKKGISQARLCREMGINQPYFNKIINGKNKMNPKLAVQLELFGIGKAQTWGQLMIEEELNLQNKLHSIEEI